MKIIKEDIANLERCIENDRVDAVGSMPITMADAFYQSQKNDEELEEQEKDAVKVPEPEKVIGAEKQPVPKMPEEPKLNLEESLFEDYDSDVRHYSDILFDMIEEGALDAADIAKDLIYWCSEEDIKRYMEVNQLIGEFIDDDEEVEEECLKEEKEDKFHKGQKVKYNGKVTTIIDIENDPEYGIDLLIKNPDWDGKDNKSENIWVADKVDLIDEECLKEDTEEDKYYAALDIPKGPERKKVAAERRKEFLDKHDLEDRAQEWKDAKGKDDPEEEEDLFTRVNDELFPYDMEVVKLFTKLPDVPASKRYHGGDIGVDYDGNVLVYADEDEDFDFAKQVAQAYGLEITEPKQNGKHKVVRITIPQE